MGVGETKLQFFHVKNGIIVVSATYDYCLDKRK